MISVLLTIKQSVDAGWIRQEVKGYQRYFPFFVLVVKEARLSILQNFMHDFINKSTQLEESRANTVQGRSHVSRCFLPLARMIHRVA